MADQNIYNTRKLYDNLIFAWKNSPFYRELYAGAGIREKDLSHIEIADLPIVTKDDISDNFDAVVTDPRLKKEQIRSWLEDNHDPRSKYLDEFIVVHTSDVSSGFAVFAYDVPSWQVMSLEASPYLWPSGIRKTGKFRNAFYVGAKGHVTSVTAAVNSSPAFIEPLLLSLVDPIDEVLARLNAFQPDRVTSYASSLGWLAELSLAGRLKIAPHDVVVSSDRLTPAIEALVQKAWDPAVYDLYAATESPFLAVRQPGMPQWTVTDRINWLEILDKQNRPVAPGDTGRAVLTNLANTVTPLIRYELNDYLVRGEAQSARMAIAGFAGRTFDQLPVLLDDRRLIEIPAYDLVKFTLPSLDAIQFIPHSPELLEIDYCSAVNLDEAVEAEFSQFLLARGASRVKLVIRRVAHIWNDSFTLKAKLVARPADTHLSFPLELLDDRSEDLAEVAPGPANPFVPFLAEQVESSIPACFEQQVARTPQSIAIKAGSQVLTFQELNCAANRVARTISMQRKSVSFPVVLFFNHSPAMVIAMLAALKAGAVYIPLNPDHPAARNAAIIRDVHAALLLTDSEGLANAIKLGPASPEIINIDEIDAGTAFENLEIHLNPTSPACIYYTSGSTGSPKGILLDHRAVLHRVKLYTNDCHISTADRLSLIQLYIYNASIREIFGALLNGSRLCLYNVKKEGIHHLAMWMVEEKITVFYAAPAVYRALLRTLKGEHFPELRLIRLGGEAVLPKDIEGFHKSFRPGCLLMNGLASTETGTICQYFVNHQVQVIGSHVPVGYPVADKYIYVCDEAGNPLPDGEVGEIVVESPFLGPGHFSGSFDDPAPLDHSVAKRRFASGDMGYCLPDRRFFLLGRKDWVVKVRGQRINLVEIEQALLSLDYVADAAVTRQEKPGGNAFLVAFVLPVANPGPETETIRRDLRALLPESMVPAAIMFVEQLPKTLNGKIDRFRLPEVDLQSGKASEPASLPRTQVEERLVAIWRDLLDIEYFGVEDSFFELGGDSITAAIMMAKIEEWFGVKLPLFSLYQHNTISGLAKLLEEEEIAEPTNVLISLQPFGILPPVFFIPGIGGDVLALHDLVAGMGTDRPLFGLQWVAYDRQQKSISSLEKMAAESVRLLQARQPQGPYLLTGYSMGGLLALEIGRQLLALGENVPLVVLLDTFPPRSERTTTLTNRARAHLRNILRFRSFGDFYRYMQDRLRRIFLRIVRHAPARAVIEQLGLPITDQVSAAYFMVENHHLQPYPGKVVLFKATQRDWFVEWDQMEGWKDLVKGDLETIEIEGEHISLLKGDSAMQLARQLAVCFETYDQS